MICTYCETSNDTDYYFEPAGVLQRDSRNNEHCRLQTSRLSLSTSVPVIMIDFGFQLHQELNFGACGSIGSSTGRTKNSDSIAQCEPSAFGFEAYRA